MEDLANEIELSVLSFFQKRRGFEEWWDSLDENTRAGVEQNLIDCISLRLNKLLTGSSGEFEVILRTSDLKRWHGITAIGKKSQ